MTTHVSAFGRALCRIGTDAPGTGDVLAPSDQATCPACRERLGLAMQPNGMTNGAQWCATVTLPCYRCGERTQWRTADHPECMTCYAKEA